MCLVPISTSRREDADETRPGHWVRDERLDHALIEEPEPRTFGATLENVLPIAPDFHCMKSLPGRVRQQQGPMS